MKKFLVIDLFNLIHRAYHALPKEFSDKEGNPTNAIYGVSSMLITVIQQVSPDYVVAVLDTAVPTFRHVDFTGYKAHRRPMENELSVQIPRIKDIVSSFGIKMISTDGYEADDLVGTIAVKNSKRFQMILFSNDHDLWQLVNENVLIMLPSTKGDKIEWIGEKEVLIRLGVTPNQVPDYKGLVGDQSDNIPGVHGIGGKGAANLIKEFGTVEEIYNNLDKITTESIRKKLIDGYEQAVMSKKLATIDTSTPIDFSLEDSRYGKIPLEKIVPIFEFYNFKSLLKRLGVTPQDKKENEKKFLKGLFDE